MAIVTTFVDAVATAFPIDADPIALATTVFGAESVAAVAKVGAAAVVALEAEAALTGGAITERAAKRVAGDMARRVAKRARRATPRPLALRSRDPYGKRVRRAPRARRAHRRAVRLSAVASAGDGPPPREPAAATRAPDSSHLSLAGVWVPGDVPTEPVHVDDTAVRAAEATP